MPAHISFYSKIYSIGPLNMRPRKGTFHKKEIMKTAIVQTSPLFGETKRNVADALGLMEGVRADVYVLPELFNTGYNFIDQVELQSLAEPPTGATFRSIAEFARKRSCSSIGARFSPAVAGTAGTPWQRS